MADGGCPAAGSTCNGSHRRFWIVSRSFSVRGIASLPMRMQDVADSSVSMSPPSRAISGKWFQSPGMLRELRSLFSGGTVRDDGAEESRGGAYRPDQRIGGRGRSEKASPRMRRSSRNWKIRSPNLSQNRDQHREAEGYPLLAGAPSVLIDSGRYGVRQAGNPTPAKKILLCCLDSTILSHI